MASTTKTSTYAQAGFQPIVNHMGVLLTGSWNLVSLSASASAVGLIAKLPYGATKVHFAYSAIHTASTGAKLQFGYRTQGDSPSVTCSAIRALTDIAVTTATAYALKKAVTQPNWDNAVDGALNQFKYVQVSVGSGTASAGFVLDWQLSYRFD
jgi:hypothetical protein